MTKSIAIKNLNNHFTGMMCCQKEWAFIRANIEAQPKASNSQSKQCTMYRKCNSVDKHKRCYGVPVCYHNYI